MGGALADQLTEFLARGGKLTVEGEELRFRGPKDARPLLQTLRPFARQLVELLRLGEPVLEDGGRLWILPHHLQPDGSCGRCGQLPATWWCYAEERLLRCSACADWCAAYERDGREQIHITAARAAELRGLLEGRTPRKPPVLRAASQATNPVGVAPPADGRCPHCQQQPMAWWKYRGRPELFCGSCSTWEAGAVIDIVWNGTPPREEPHPRPRANRSTEDAMPVESDGQRVRLTCHRCKKVPYLWWRPMGSTGALLCPYCTSPANPFEVEWWVLTKPTR